MGFIRVTIRSSVMAMLMTSLVGVLVTASLTTAENLNYQRGNDTITALCGNGGYKRLTKQDGTPFRSERECIRYAMRNGGVSALATVAPAPAPGRTREKLPAANIKLTPVSLFPATPTAVPTSAPYPSPWIDLRLYYSGHHCTVSAFTNSLVPGTSYIIAVHVKDKSGETVIYEKEILRAASKYDEHLVPIPFDGLPSVATVYLYEIQGDSLVQRDFDGPLKLNERCDL